MAPPDLELIENELKVKVRSALTDALKVIDDLVVNKFFNMATDVAPQLKMLETRMKNHCHVLLAGVDLPADQVPFKNSAVEEEEVKREYESRIEEIKEESQKRIEEIREINEQRIEDLKTITTELRQPTKRKPAADDDLPYSKRPRTVKFEDEKDDGNETDYGYVTNADLEDENDSDDETVEINTKKKGGSSSALKKKPAASGRRTSSRAGKSEQEYTALEMRKCLHISLIGVAGKGGKKFLSDKDVEGACSKAAHWYLTQLTGMMQKFFYNNYAKERSPLKRGRGCHARFITIFNEFLFSPEEKKKVYLFMLRVFWEAVPDDFSTNFAKNASDIMLMAVNYMFRLPFNEQLDPQHNKPFENLYEAWKKKQLTIEFLRSLNTGFGNMFFFAEDPVRLISSMFVCLAEGQNYLLGPDLGEDDYGYYSIDYDTNDIVASNKTKPKVKRDLSGYIHSQKSNIFYVKYKNDDLSFVPRWEKEKGSMLQLEEPFPFEATLKSRASFKFLHHFTKLASDCKAMRTFNDAFPNKFNGVKFSGFMKNVVQLTPEELKDACWTKEKMTDTYLSDFKGSDGKAPQTPDKDPEESDSNESPAQSPPQQPPADPAPKQSKSKPDASSSSSSSSKDKPQIQKNGAPRSKPKPRQMNSEVEDSDDEKPVPASPPHRPAGKRLPERPPVLPIQKEDESSSVSELDGGSSEEDERNPKPFQITKELLNKKIGNTPKSTDLDDVAALGLDF